MKKIYFLFIILSFFAKSQTIIGKILSKEGNQPIPFVKIGIQNSEIGTISDENGVFKFDLSKVDPGSSLMVEVGGFEKYLIKIADFSKEKWPIIYLKEKIKNIEEIVLLPKNYINKNLGIKSKTKLIEIGHIPFDKKDAVSREIALEFTSKRKTKIEKVNANFSYFKADRPVFIRINVYDKNFNSVLTEDIHSYIEKKDLVGSSFSLDVSKYGIWVKDKFYVGIELLNYFEGNIYFSGALFHNGFYRDFLGEWKKIPTISPAINIDVKVEK